MKKPYLVLSLAVAVIFALGSAAAWAGNGLPVNGPHYQFNIIGHPKNTDAIGGDDSNGRAIMIPLKNASRNTEITCEADQATFTDDMYPVFTNQEPAGARIYFEAGDHFEILDRDATDSNGATIMVPTVAGPDPLDPYGTQPVISVDVFIRVLGKPNTCMDINGYAEDADQGLWFWSGRVDLNRKHGKSSFIDISEIFDVYWCQTFVDISGNIVCDPTTVEELSVFNNVFESYFWSILNDGTRIAQVRLYPRAN